MMLISPRNISLILIFTYTHSFQNLGEVLIMRGNKEKDLLDKICTHDGVLAKKLSSGKYLVQYKGRSWYLWPHSGQYQFIDIDGKVSDIYYGELQLFYHRYITETVNLPANLGKFWSRTDEETLCEMVYQSYSIRQIAEELERHPINVVEKLARLTECKTLMNELHENLFDVPVKEIVDIDSI